jgi:hypothetical protein
MTQMSMKASLMFPVREIISPVKAGLAALLPLSVMAYNYYKYLKIKVGKGTVKKVLSFPVGMSSAKIARPPRTQHCSKDI